MCLLLGAVGSVRTLGLRPSRQCRRTDLVAERRVRGSRDRGISARLWWSARARNCYRARTRGTVPDFARVTLGRSPAPSPPSSRQTPPRASARPSTDARHPVRARWTQSYPKGGSLQSIAVRRLASASAARAEVDLRVPVRRRCRSVRTPLARWARATASG
jgi:hypothetical protein